MRISKDSLTILTESEALHFLKLSAALRKAWNKDTAYPDDAARWNENDPTIGQCAVTSLVVQDYGRGNIHKNSAFKHYWNELPSGAFLDFTREQFKTTEPITSEGTIIRSDLLSGERAGKAQTQNRYNTLKKRVKIHLKHIRPTLFLLSSNAKAEYIHDIVEVVATPKGTIHHFRYRLRYIDPALKKLIPDHGQPLAKDIQNVEVVVLYLNQNEITAGQYTWNALLPIRAGRLKQCYKTGQDENSSGHFFFEVEDHLLQSNDFLQKIKTIFDRSFHSAYAFLTFDDTTSLATKQPANALFEIQCEGLKGVGLTFQSHDTTVEYQPPLMILIEGIYKKGWFKTSKLVRPSYDLIAPQSFYKLREAKTYYYRFRTYSWDYKKPYDITLNVPKELFCTPEKYPLAINSSYDSQCWQLTPAFITQNTSGFMTLEVQGQRSPPAGPEGKRELDWKVFTTFEVKRKISIWLLDTFSDLLFALGPVYIAGTKLFENIVPKPWWIESWPYVLGGIYFVWFTVKLVRRSIGTI